MARSRKLEIQIVGDASGGTRALSTIEGRLGKTGRAFGKFGRAAAVGLGAIAVGGAAAVISVGRDLMNMERLNAQTRTAIRSSGGAANVTQRQVTALAESLQAMSGIQQESIIEGQNLLLTYHRVSNEAGRGNDIFNQATRIMTDMSVAMGTDASTEAMRLGKALNDPVRGVTALTRVGVQFTDQQRAQIEAMVESGDTLGAQRIILGELRSEFGGSAAAFGQTTAGQFARAKEAAMDVVEGLVVYLMPAVSQAAAWIRTTVIPALQQFADWLGPRLGVLIQQVSAWVRDNWPEISRTATEVFSQVREAISSAVDFVTAIWSAFGDDIVGYATRAFSALTQVVRGVWTTIRGIFQTFAALLRGDWGGMWDGIVTVLRGVWNTLVGIVRMGINTIRTTIGMAWQVLRNLVRGAWDGILNVIRGAWEAIVRTIRTQLTTVRTALTSAWNTIRSAVRNAWNGYTDLIRNAWQAIGRNVRTGVDAVVGFVRAIPTRIANFASGAFNSLVNSFRGAINTIIGWWNGLDFTFPGYDIPGPGPNIPSFTIGMPDIPRLATGGTVTRSGTVMVGERGPELLNLNRGAQVAPLERAGIVVNIYGDADTQAIAKLEAALRRGVPTPGLDRKIRRLAV